MTLHLFFTQIFLFPKIKNLESGSLWFSVASWEAVSGCQSQISPESTYSGLKVVHVIALCHLGIGVPALQHHSLSLNPEHKE